MRRQVLGNQRNQVQLAEHHRGRHRQVTPCTNAAAGRQLFGLIQVQQDALAVLHIAPARFGHAQAARAACQQQRAQALLQAGNHAGYAGW
ncbi:hypothetical protein D3C78_1421050 [compost metagenome]